MLQYFHVDNVINAVKPIWILSNLEGLHIMITILYWSLEFTPHQFSLREICLHIIPCLYVVLNTVISCKPWRLLHVYQPAILVLIYMIFSRVYFIYYPKTMYKHLNWSLPGQTIAMLLGIIFIIITVLHIALTCIHIASHRLLKGGNCC